jgi:hypothetical protein
MYVRGYLQGSENGRVVTIDLYTSYFPYDGQNYTRSTKGNKGNNKITELRTILQRESQNS